MKMVLNIVMAKTTTVFHHYPCLRISPYTVITIPTSIVRGEMKPMKPSGCLPTKANNKKLKANKPKPIRVKSILFFESLS